jgi:hypothetical protein
MTRVRVLDRFKFRARHSSSHQAFVSAVTARVSVAPASVASAPPLVPSTHRADACLRCPIVIISRHGALTRLRVVVTRPVWQSRGGRFLLPLSMPRHGRVTSIQVRRAKPSPASSLLRTCGPAVTDWSLLSLVLTHSVRTWDPFVTAQGISLSAFPIRPAQVPPDQLLARAGSLGS